ncbi:MAG: hypothetical protein F6K21_29015 [Symploca sp. SIO2D2]|nr:hypothetical protein [Symploca sp. SIO2D2]
MGIELAEMEMRSQLSSIGRTWYWAYAIRPYIIVINRVIRIFGMTYR